MLDASALILCHNHPSGDVSPSRDDIAVTERVSAAAYTVGVHLLDHVIVAMDGSPRFTSLHAEGMIRPPGASETKED